MQGTWDSGTRGWGEFEKEMSGAMDLPTEFIVYYPPVSNELHGDLPAEYVRVSVDWMEVETHKRIYSCCLLHFKINCGKETSLNVSYYKYVCSVS